MSIDSFTPRLPLDSAERNSAFDFSISPRSKTPSSSSVKTNEAAQSVIRKRSKTLGNDQESEEATSPRSRSSSIASPRKKTSFADAERFSQTMQSSRSRKESLAEKRKSTSFRDTELFSRTNQSFKANEAAQSVIRKRSKTLQNDQESEGATSPRSRSSSIASPRKKTSFADAELFSQTMQPSRSGKESSAEKRKSTSFRDAELFSRTNQSLRPRKESPTEKRKSMSFKEAEKISKTVATTDLDKETKPKFSFSSLFRKKTAEKKDAKQIDVLERKRYFDPRSPRKKELNPQKNHLSKWSAYPVSGALFMELCSSHGGLMAACVRIEDRIINLKAQHEECDAEELKKLAEERQSTFNQLESLLKERRLFWEESAKKHLEKGTKPENEKEQRTDFEEIYTAMARQLLEKYPARKLGGGSGEAYLIGPENKPFFVFKAISTPKDFPVVDDRICDEARFAFPISEDPLREYAMSLLFPEGPVRILASLRFNTIEKKGVLIQYKEHLFTVDDLVKEVELAYNNDKKPRPELSEDQKELVELCLSQFKNNPLSSGESVSKKHLDPLWEKVSKESLDQMLSELFQFPNVDPNGGNLLIKKGTNGYEVVSIDAGQTFPDTWVPLNSPPWLGLKSFNRTLSSSLCDVVRDMNAKRTLENLREFGIVFQEIGKKIFHAQLQEDLQVGGDLYDIIHAFHTVVKIGYLNENYVNEIASVLYGNFLKDFFVRASRNFNENNYDSLSRDDYQDLLMHDDYSEFFPESDDTKEIWNLFEASIVEKLNKLKSKRK